MLYVVLLHKSQRNGKWDAGSDQVTFTVLLFSRAVVSDSLATPWTVACQVPLSMGFPRQEYWSGLPFSSPGDLADPRTESESPAWQADSLQLRHQGGQGSIFTIHFGKILYALPRSFGNLI